MESIMDRIRIVIVVLLAMISPTCFAFPSIARPNPAFQVSMPFHYHPPLIATMMPDDPLTDAIIKQLNAHKTHVVDPHTTKTFLNRRNINRYNYLNTDNLVKIKDYPFDAILEGQIIGHTHHRAQVAKYTLRSALTGAPLAHAEWYYWRNQFPDRKHMNQEQIAHKIVHQLLNQAKKQTDWGI